LYDVYKKWLAPLLDCISWPKGVDEARLEYGYTPFEHEFIESSEYHLLGKHATKKLDSSEEPLSKVIQQWEQFLGADTITEIRQRWGKAQAELHDQYTAIDSAKEKILRYLEGFCNAEDALKDAIDTSLQSNEYLRNKCEWCP
jgi:hypothetical protein